MSGIKRLWQTLGPGFLYAGAAVGVSHLVQSTKAGAHYGLALVGLVFLSNFFKFPFFEAGPRYAAATGEHLISGYKGSGNWAMLTFLGLTLSSVFIIQAAVTIVTAALFVNLTGLELSFTSASAILLTICGLILFVGQYKWLDRIIKWVVILLSLASLIAFIKAWTNLSSETVLFPEILLDNNTFIFLFALLGWMPAPLDISVWHSLWTLEKKESRAQQLSLREVLRDFHIGYWGTAVLAMIFVALGAFVLYPQGVNLLNAGGIQFSESFLSMYTETLGKWTYPIIAFAAFATMFSTTITVLDGGPRVLKEVYLIYSAQKGRKFSSRIYQIMVILIGLGSFILIWLFSGEAVFSLLIKVATIAGFCTAPLFAILNYRLIFLSKEMPMEARPPRFTKVVALTGILLLSAFTLAYLAYLFGLIQLS